MINISTNECDFEIANLYYEKKTLYSSEKINNYISFIQNTN